MFDKVRSIKVSERVFDIVAEELEGLARNCKYPIDGYLETFNNCREQGYVMCISDDYRTNREVYLKNIYIWAFEHRSSDNIEVIYGYDYPRNGMFDEDSYRNRVKCFDCDDYSGAAKYIVNIVEHHLDKYKAENNISF